MYVPSAFKPAESVPKENVDKDHPFRKPDDAEYIIKTTCVGGKGADRDTITREMIQTWLDDPGIIIIRGFDENNKLVGVLLARIGTVFHIEILCSSKPGYGTVLEAIAQETALANGYEKVALVPLESARGFYKKLGYGVIVPRPHMMGTHIKRGGKRKTRRRKMTRRNKASSKALYRRGSQSHTGSSRTNRSSYGLRGY